MRYITIFLPVVTLAVSTALDFFGLIESGIFEWFFKISEAAIEGDAGKVKLLWESVPGMIKNPVEYGIQVGLFIWAYRQFQSLREKRLLKMRRKFAFGALLHRSRELDDNIKAVSEQLVQVVNSYVSSIQDALDSIIDSGIDIYPQTDEEWKKIRSVLVKSQKQYEEVFVDAIGELDDRLATLRKHEYIIDDTIEAHAVQLDFESAHLANQFRSCVRELVELAQKFRNDVVARRERDNTKLQNQLIKEWDNFIDKQSSQLRMNDDELLEKQKNAIIKSWIEWKEDQSKSFGSQIEDMLSSVRDAARPLYDYILDEKIVSVTSMQVKKAKTDSNEEHMVVNTDNDDKIGPFVINGVFIASEDD